MCAGYRCALVVDQLNKKKPQFELRNDIFGVLKKLDPVTYKHSFSVANIAIWFVESTGLNMDLSIVYYSGLFHDIGKSQTNGRILNKSSKLNIEEFDMMKQHTKAGYNMLKHTDLPKSILDAVLYHHERYDGKGYPEGLAGKEIPDLARVINICDVYDALTSDRPYRKGYSIPEALYIMKEMRNYFDPDLFPAFVNGVERLLHNKEIDKMTSMIPLKPSF
jgi:putative nucleotidyltransferase with HDIG domain